MRLRPAEKPLSEIVKLTGVLLSLGVALSFKVVPPRSALDVAASNCSGTIQPAGTQVRVTGAADTDLELTVEAV